MVRDTDGSAFITKAEFDSLKNNFQSQIDNYNSSIDNKIDGAIASYLAGISISQRMEIKMPTNQRVFKTLDATNFSQDFDNVRLTCLLTNLYESRWTTLSTFPFWARLNYKQNAGTNVGSNIVAEALPYIGNNCYAIIKGWATDFVDDINLINITGGTQGITADNEYYTVYKNFEIFIYPEVPGDFCIIDPATDIPILGEKRDKVGISLNFCGNQEKPGASTHNFMNNIIVDLGIPSDQESLSASSESFKLNRSSEKITYTIQSDPLVMVLGPDHATPVQFDNCWSLGETTDNYKKYCAEYVTWGSRGQTIKGNYSASKPWTNTTSYPSKAGNNKSEAQALLPYAWADVAVRTTSESFRRTGTTSKTYNWHAEDAHVYITSSQNFKIYDQYALSNEYSETGLLEDINTKWGSSAIYTSGDRKLYKLENGLVLCNVEGRGILHIGLTAKTDNVYFFLYDKPALRTENGINTSDGSDPSKGNGVPLIKDEHVVLRYSVEPGIYFFRFGSYSGDWTNLAGGAQIEFDNTFELETEQ